MDDPGACCSAFAGVALLATWHGNVTTATPGTCRRRVTVHSAPLLAQGCWGSAAVVNRLGQSGAGMRPLLFVLLREVCALPIILTIIYRSRGVLAMVMGACLGMEVIT